MECTRVPSKNAAILPRESLDILFEKLRSQGFEVIGPTKEGSSIVFDRIASAADLPVGWQDHHGRGSYRISNRGDQRVFGFSSVQNSAKTWLYPPKRQLWSIVRRGRSLEIHPSSEPIPQLALIGLRACDLKGIEILDKVLLSRKFTDEDYRARRKKCLLVAVNCGGASEVCFCSSVGSGPRADAGYDLCLTELLDGDGHRFLVEFGSRKGEAILSGLPMRQPTSNDLAAFDAELARAELQITKTLDRTRLKETLYESVDNPRWKETAGRCLSCGNCTLSCPTCFCTNVEDQIDVDSRHSTRSRTWDSCFNTDFSYIHGGSVRQTGASKYRQWLTHKFAAWTEQFDALGCVGCGRCITWCPAAIDVTEEIAALQNPPAAEVKQPNGKVSETAAEALFEVVERQPVATKG